MSFRVFGYSPLKAQKGRAGLSRHERSGGATRSRRPTVPPPSSVIRVTAPREKFLETGVEAVQELQPMNCVDAKHHPGWIAAGIIALVAVALVAAWFGWST